MGNSGNYGNYNQSMGNYDILTIGIINNYANEWYF